jgi:hypothetical protein
MYLVRKHRRPVPTGATIPCQPVRSQDSTPYTLAARAVRDIQIPTQNIQNVPHIGRAKQSNARVQFLADAWTRSGSRSTSPQGSRFKVPARTRIKVSSGTDGLAAPARRSRLDSTASTNENPRRDSPSVLHCGPWRLITSTPRLQVDARKKGCRHGSTGACIIDACLPNLWGFASPSVLASLLPCFLCLTSRRLLLWGQGHWVSNKSWLPDA